MDNLTYNGGAIGRAGGEKRLSVALCTYNGARYLREQLDSIASQTRLPEEMIVCDDQSGDGSAEIVEAFASEAPFPVQLHVNKESLGAIRNFEKAIGLCNGDFIALSDQDDVWLPDKLETTLKMLCEAEAKHGPATPLLAHTDLQIVDTERRPVARSFYRHQGFRRLHRDSLAELLLENYVTGCTVLMNRALKEAGLPIPQQALMQDWWLALVAAASGRVISLTEATVLYRQHEANAVGARRRNLKKYFFGWKSFVNRVRGRFSQSEALEERLQNVRDHTDCVAFLSRYHCQIRGGGFYAVYWLLRNGVAMQGPTRTLVIYFLLLARTFGPSETESE